MTTTGTVYTVAALSIQPEGGLYLVGDPDTNRFYQLPEIGVRILGMLRQGSSAEEIERFLPSVVSEPVDLQDFLATLMVIGFIQESNADPTPLFKAKPVSAIRVAAARVVFSLPFLVCYILTLVAALVAYIRFPLVRPSVSVFYFPHNLTASFLLLLIGYVPIVLLHEVGHMLAAARRGLNSRLGIGNRLWMIVLEADLTSILSLPRRQRYLPLLAGLMTDLLSLSLLVLLIALLVLVHAPGFTIQVIQALLLQTVIIMSWQSNLFLRTDLYFVLCTALQCPDLDRDARQVFRSWLRGVTRQAPIDQDVRSTHARPLVVWSFAVVWILGRAASVAFLLLIVVPTLTKYASQAYRAVRSAPTLAGSYDALAFVFLSICLLGYGSYLWFSKHLQHRGKRLA